METSAAEPSHHHVEPADERIVENGGMIEGAAEQEKGLKYFSGLAPYYDHYIYDVRYIYICRRE